MFAFRLAAVAGALSLSLLLSGCGYGRLHIRIPDFVANGVDGIRLFRLVDGGLQSAGLSTPWGPLTAIVKRPASGQVDLELSLINAGAPGYFRFASYNEKGTSPLADGRIYIQAIQ
jgi:hypothetical protein